MPGSKEIARHTLNLYKIKHASSPAAVINILRQLVQVIEDVYSVGTIAEFLSAIEDIGAGAGTIFLESGTLTITETINIDQCGSIRITGHGDKTILKPDAGITVFNITCAATMLIENLRLDLSNYIANTQGIIINEASDNLVSLNNVTIDGNGTWGIGVEILSDACFINHCRMSELNDGIYLNGSDRTTLSDNTIYLNARYGLYLNTSSFNLITNNYILANVSHGLYIITASDANSISDNLIIANEGNGIYISTCDNENIIGNYIVGNELNGIYMYDTDVCTITSNTCVSNESNTANPQAGLYLDWSSNENAILSNFLSSNINTGAGIGYGIYIANANCVDNVVQYNHIDSNDVNWMDIGTNTDIEYRCSTNAEIQDAVDSIDAKSGRIKLLNIVGGIQITAGITINGAGDYIIEGEGFGTVLQPDDGISVFAVGAVVNSIIFRDFTIDMSLYTADSYGFYCDGDNRIIENIYIYGNNTDGIGIFFDDDYCKVSKCIFKQISIGIQLDNSANHIIIEGCSFNDCHYRGIEANGAFIVISGNTFYGMLDLATTSCIYSVANSITITGNSFYHCRCGVELNNADRGVIVGNVFTSFTTVANSYGVHLYDGANYNTISGNQFQEITGGVAIAIWIENAACNINTIGANGFQGCDTDITDGGTGTVIFGDDTAYGVSWNADMGTATKNAIYDKLSEIFTQIYYVSSDAELDAAIADIQANNYEGRIIITNDLTNVQVTINDASASFIIEGSGQNITLDPNGNQTVFTVLNCASLIIRDLTINLGVEYVVNTTEVISLQGGTNILIDNITIIGDGVDGYGIGTMVNNVEITRCNINSVHTGILLSSDDNIVHGNTIQTTSTDGIRVSVIGDRNLIADNILRSNVGDGIDLDAGGNDNQLSGNIYSNNGNNRTDGAANTIYGARYS